MNDPRALAYERRRLRDPQRVKKTDIRPLTERANIQGDMTMNIISDTAKMLELIQESPFVKRFVADETEKQRRERQALFEKRDKLRAQAEQELPVMREKVV